MMTREEAEALVKRVTEEDPAIRLNGYKKFGPKYVVDFVDARTGRAFTLRSEEDWERRKGERL